MLLSIGGKYYIKAETNSTMFRSLGEGVFLYSIHLNNILEEELRIINDGYFECRVIKVGEVIVPLISFVNNNQRMIFEVIGVVEDFEAMESCNLLNVILVDEHQTIKAMKMVSINLDIWAAWLGMQRKINAGNLEYTEYAKVIERIKLISLWKLWDNATETLT